MAWRVARSLETLRSQVNAAYPNRSKRSDGTIGDAAHAASVSDHNPDEHGVVRALDLTHDPAHGLDSYALAEQLRASRDPRIKYIISNRRICSATIAPWTWRPYSGADPHTSHVHLSVVPDSRADSTTPWALPMLTREEDDMFTDEDRKLLKNAHNRVMARPNAAPRLMTDLDGAYQNAKLDRLENAIKALATGIGPTVEQAVDAALADNIVIQGDVTVTPTPEA